MPSLMLGAAVAAAAAVNRSSCVSPGVCEAPARKYVKSWPIKPRQQWNTAGGFCGSVSVQVMMMSYGAWVSQDLVRKANIGAPCAGHSSAGMGCEVAPENYNLTAAGLNTHYDVWDYAGQPQPQAKAFKSWIKSHLAKGAPVMWAPICKGDSHTPYGPASCPGGGHFDHHEPLIGIGSNHDLSDETVYDDDWVLHFSDQDLQTYYRTFESLQDSTDLDGNCKDAQAGFGKNEMYPCFYEQVTYGLAINGLKTLAPTQRVAIDVDSQTEPNVRERERAINLHSTVHVYGLTEGKTYTLYRYKDALPTDSWETGVEYKWSFKATADEYVFQDPNPFTSSGATFYAVPSL